MLIAPCLDTPLRLNLGPDVTSASYVELTRQVNRKPTAAWTPALILGLVVMIVIGLGTPAVWSGVPCAWLRPLGLVYAVGMRGVIREHSGGRSSPLNSRRADAPA